MIPWLLHGYMSVIEAIEYLNVLVSLEFEVWNIFKL